MQSVLSRVAQTIRPSATLAAGALARQLKAQGLHIYDFSLGEPDFPTPEHIRRAAYRAMEQGHTRYTPAAGIPELRAAISQWYRSSGGPDYSADEILVSSGAKHALYNVLAALCDPGDEVLIPAPYWVSYYDMVAMTGARPIVVPTAAEQGFKLTADALRAACTPRTKLVLVNSPCNPTGTVYTPEELYELTMAAWERGLWIVSDEIYEKLIYPPARFVRVATLDVRLRERVCTVSGVSKTYAMTGWRIGWVGAPKELVQAMANIQSQQTGCPCSVSQYAALAAVTGDQSCVEQMRQEFEKRRDLVCRAVANIPRLALRPTPGGAFYAFINVQACLGAEVNGQTLTDDVAFCQWALHKVQVNLVPGSAFGAPGYVRLSFAASREELQAGLDRLERFVQELRPRCPSHNRHSADSD
ncbi:MAG: aspartate aminotransferase [Gemmataceae bacterium]